MPEVPDPVEESGAGADDEEHPTFPSTDGPPSFAGPSDRSDDEPDRGIEEAPEENPEPEPDDAAATGGATDREPVPSIDLSGVEAGLDRLTAETATVARENTVTSGLAGLQKGIDELVRLTRRADEHVAELHAENQRLRAGEIETATRPLLRDLVRLHDEVLALTEAAAEEARDDLGLVRSRLVDALARWGLTADDPPPGSTMDPTRHHGVGTVPASDDAEPGTIASVRRIGFVHDDGRVLRAAEVEVFRTADPPTPPADPTPDDTPTPDPDDQES